MDYGGSIAKGTIKSGFYGSPNLKDWNLLSEFGPQGFTNAAWECPFLIQLPIDGNSNHPEMGINDFCRRACTRHIYAIFRRRF